MRITDVEVIPLRIPEHNGHIAVRGPRLEVGHPGGNHAAPGRGSARPAVR
ncbi:MAG: hypothetical protein U0Z44_07795 [Kouleothrix sp.]